MTSAVARLLDPASVAIVGASDKVGPGLNAWRALERVGYQGRIYLVNPKRPVLWGRQTFPSLEAIPGPLDAVFVAVPREAALEAVEQAAAKGAGGVAMLASGFGEAGPEGLAAQARLAAIAGAHRLAVCGPNCLGLINLAGASALFGTSLPERLPRGRVAAVVQSGSAGIALLNADRGLGLSHLISSGNEAITTAADYIEVLADDPRVAVVVAFLEQIRQPERFVAAARRARERGKPVIVLKTGRSERGRQAVAAHTGAIAGADEACSAALRAAGAIRVGSLDELIETALLASTLERRPERSGVGMMSPSGGEIALALDIAEPIALDLPPLETSAAPLAALLPEFAHVANPLDLTWSGLYDTDIARRCAELMGGEPAIGLLVLLQDAPRGLGLQQVARYASCLRGIAAGAAAAGKPLVAVSNLAGEVHPDFLAAAEASGVPCLRGTYEGLSAIARLVRWAAEREPEAPAPTPAPARTRAGERLRDLPGGRLPTEREAREVLAAYGIEGPREKLATTLDEAIPAARAVGFPVVLKGLVQGVVHKSEAGLVAAGLRSEEEVRQAVLAMVDRVQALGRERFLGFALQALISPVAELLAGGRVDPDFGPVVVVGAGGLLVELYRDVAVRLAPVSEAGALDMLRETRAHALLSGWRGRPAGDVQAVAQTVAALSRFVADFSGEVVEVELNPLAALEVGRGAVALDCVIVRRRPPEAG